MRNSRLSTSLIAAIALLVQAPVALAATGVTPWKTYLFSAMAIAMTIAVFAAFKNPKAESTPAKLLLAGLYFWVITFAELIVLAFIYYLTK